MIMLKKQNILLPNLKIKEDKEQTIKSCEKAIDSLLKEYGYNSFDDVAEQCNIRG